MQRYHYLAHCRHGVDPSVCFRDVASELQERMKETVVRHLSLFHYGSKLFLYYESPLMDADPHALFKRCESGLEQWPGTDTPRRWVPMMDIFHYQQPVGAEHWRRIHPSPRPYARIARLKPEQVASYIFYHYQYQEERPGDGDKYGMISLYENLLFFYSESPATIEPPPYAGKLDTANTPSDWQAAMDPHFIMWDQDAGKSLAWLEIPLLLQLEGEAYDEEHAR
ncbi:hypothetical protein [Paenibacillus sp. ATY16]|uniref:hypothetical protein n=1 Tax=Paenibacillus sp. ATY16 TaxID=1759312 RepID=UPI00200D475B|nr:hypothetical protein [Paenibacillus sp. ATY16]MCK9862896.1 hypothetical protein [Paenibacillus sp. ATY16]